MKNKPTKTFLSLRKLILSLAFCAAFCSASGQHTGISSPSGKIRIEVDYGDRLFYQVGMGGLQVISNSPMGFKFKNEPEMASGFRLLERQERNIRENWIPVVASKHARISNNCNELRLSLIERSGLRRKMDLEFRVFDDGVAFRYRLYRSEKVGNRQLMQEMTGFNLPGDPIAWIADYGGYISSRESEFSPQSLSRVSSRVKAGLPLLLEIDKQHYAAITEAKIENYPGFFIGVDQDTSAKGIHLSTKLSPLPYEREEGVKARFAAELYTPWRVILLGKTPGSLIESEIITNLNDPCAIKDAASWIRPGISAWDHWWSGDVKMDMPDIKQHIDFAGKQGWPYMIIDWQWYGAFDKPEADISKPAPQLNMPELLAYAKAKKVRLWLWLTNGDANRNGNFEKAFALYERWGIAGVKIDFMDRDDQDMVNWYHEIIKTAAAHHLLVDFHGAYKPDGIIRTWPNMLTREGVMGNEYNKWSERETPEHNVTLPFTRMLAGQMDYTPGGFVNVTKVAHKQTLPTQVMNSRCAELAKFVIYESPFTVACESPERVLGQPGADFLKVVPTVWSDTHVLSGYPGEHIVLVKRSGTRFFIGAMTNSEPRKLEQPLDFLPPGSYRMTSWADADDAGTQPTHLDKRVRIVTARESLSIKMTSGGGFVAILEPLKIQLKTKK